MINRQICPDRSLIRLLVYLDHLMGGFKTGYVRDV